MKYNLKKELVKFENTNMNYFLNWKATPKEDLYWKIINGKLIFGIDTDKKFYELTFDNNNVKEIKFFDTNKYLIVCEDGKKILFNKGTLQDCNTNCLEKLKTDNNIANNEIYYLNNVFAFNNSLNFYKYKRKDKVGMAEFDITYNYFFSEVLPTKVGIYKGYSGVGTKKGMADPGYVQLNELWVMELENANIKDKNGIKFIKSPFKKVATIERRLSNVVLNKLRAIFRNEELTEEVKKIDFKKYFGKNKVEIVINEDNISKKGIMDIYKQIEIKKIKNNEIEEAINEIKEIIKRIIVSEDYTDKNINDNIKY